MKLDLTQKIDDYTIFGLFFLFKYISFKRFKTAISTLPVCFHIWHVDIYSRAGILLKHNQECLHSTRLLLIHFIIGLYLFHHDKFRDQFSYSHVLNKRGTGVGILGKIKWAGSQNNQGEGLPEISIK